MFFYKQSQLCTKLNFVQRHKDLVKIKTGVEKRTLKCSVVDWLKHRIVDQHGLGSKPTRAILLCPWERHFTAHSLLGGLDKQF